MSRTATPRPIGFIARLLISALSLAVAAYVVPGFEMDSLLSLLIAALILGVANAVVRPVLIILTLPLTILSLGLFLLVINAAIIGLVAWVVPGFHIYGFGPALLGWLMVSLIGWVSSRAFA